MNAGWFIEFGHVVLSSYTGFILDNTAKDHPPSVPPLKGGMQNRWIPAFQGMTV